MLVPPKKTRKHTSHYISKKSKVTFLNVFFFQWAPSWHNVSFHCYVTDTQISFSESQSLHSRRNRKSLACLRFQNAADTISHQIKSRIQVEVFDQFATWTPVDVPAISGPTKSVSSLKSFYPNLIQIQKNISVISVNSYKKQWFKFVLAELSSLKWPVKNTLSNKKQLFICADVISDGRSFCWV